MKRRSLLLRSLFHFRWTNAAVVFGAAVSTSVLVGALVVGESVRYSLKWIVENRLGNAQLAITTGEGFVRDELAEEISNDLGVDTTPILLLQGVALADGGRRRVHRVQVVGVDSNFWSLADARNPLVGEGADRAAVNRHLADRLSIGAGADLVIRIERVNQIPGDMPYRPHERSSLAMRVDVAEVVEDDQFGRFSVRAQQVAPLTVFVPLQHLAEVLGIEGRCNLILIAARSGGSPEPSTVKESLRKHWRLADAGLRLRQLSDRGGLELVSERVFLSSEVAEAALAVDAIAEPVMTYFVNEISSGERTTPYSFVSAARSAVFSETIGADEIVVNQWLADDLEVTKGDKISLGFFVPDEGRRLVERSAEFRVIDIVPMVGAALDQSLMPEIPGFTDAESCTDWDTSLPIDLARVRPKDEDYWESFRGTPKAFVSLDDAQRLWANRFGELTAVRYSGPELTSERVGAVIFERLTPESLGLVVAPVKAEGLKAAGESVDFGQLFLGLSFFLVVGSLLLTGLLFVLGAERRSQETGVLRALGFTPREIGRLWLTEASLLAASGAVIGGAGGVVFAHAALLGLKTVWRGAVGSAVLLVHVGPKAVLTGAIVGLALAVLTMALAHRSTSSRTVSELLSGVDRARFQCHRGRARRWTVLAGSCVVGAVSMVIAFGLDSGQAATGAFWGAGALMLVATMCASYSWLIVRDGKRPEGAPSLGSLAVAEAARKRRRSTVMVALFACGVFIVVAVAANRKSSLDDAELRSSGTGGFALFGETSLSIEHDLNSPVSRRRHGLPADGPEFVQIRRRAGDDASCLNLNRTSRPTVLGVPVAELADRGAFSFAKTAPSVDPSDPWRSLEVVLPNETIPGVADQTVITWGLGLSVGDLMIVQDEHGNEIKVQLVGGLKSSVFQGSVLISETNFKKLFPSSSGDHVLLVDVPDGLENEVRDALTTGLADWGLELQAASGRLASFLVVENTYLSIFLALGGLGLILGTVGVGVIVLRDVLGRRAELALLRAIGFREAELRRLLAVEYGMLVAVGLVGGTVSALVAVLPSVLTTGSGTPWLFLCLVLGTIAANALVWVLVAVTLAVRGDLVAALRNE